MRAALEELIPLAEVSALLPARREGRRPTTQSVYRWARRGICGVRLRVAQAGGQRCTTLAALSEFFRAVAVARGSAAIEEAAPLEAVAV